MKSDLIITRFRTEPVIGTKDTNDVKTFFGSKMVKIEDNIIIDDSYIQYSEIFRGDINEENGYQFFEDLDNEETIFLINLFNVKQKHHTINIVPQPDRDRLNNTQWILSINLKNILSDYIFYKLKNRRTFKCIKYTDVATENINVYIRNYIENNLLGRYRYVRIEFFVKYLNLDDGDEYSDPNLSFDPLFVPGINTEEYQLQNINAILLNNVLTVNYKQTESSINKKFNYYFNIIFEKI